MGEKEERGELCVLFGKVIDYFRYGLLVRIGYRVLYNCKKVRKCSFLGDWVF